MNQKESKAESGEFAELPNVNCRQRSERRKKRTPLLSQMAIQLSQEKQIPLKDVIEELEKQIILRVLNEVEGSQKDTAKILGMKCTTLNEKLKRYGIRVKRVSKVLLLGFLFCCNFLALAPGDRGLLEKAKERTEAMDRRPLDRSLTRAVLAEPEKSGAARIFYAYPSRIVSLPMLIEHIHP